eukprot:51076_1
MGTCTSTPSENQTKKTMLRKRTSSITYSYVFSDEKQNIETNESITNTVNVDNIKPKVDNKGIVLVDSTYKLEVAQANSTKKVENVDTINQLTGDQKQDLSPEDYKTWLCTQINNEDWRTDMTEYLDCSEDDA